MDINTIRENIREKLKTAHNSDEIYTVCEPYKNILESCINSNPKNVAAYCLLAIVFFEMNDDEAATITLENCYEENKDTFSDYEYAIWATNMTYFIIEDTRLTDNQVEGRCESIKLLEEAVKRKSNFYQTYHALGWYCFENELFEKASEAFHTAYLMSKDKRYLCCEASCLLKVSKRIEGVKILESLYRYPFVDKEFDFQVALTLGYTLLLMGEKDRAFEIAKILLNKEYTDLDYADDRLTDFLYTLENFNYVVNFYDTKSYYEESYLSQYFYSLKMLSRDKDALLKLESVVKNIEKSIREDEEDDEFETELEREESIAYEIKRLEEIKKCYSDVFENNIKPTKEPYYDIVYDCYYIGCPRHYHSN